MAIAYYEQDTLSSTAEPHINPIASSYAKSTVSPSEVEKDKIIFYHFVIVLLYVTPLNKLVRDISHVLESCESLGKSEALRPGQCVQELGGDGGGQEVQLRRVRRGVGLQVIGNEPVAEEGAKLVAVEDSPTTFGFLFFILIFLSFTLHLRFSGHRQVGLHQGHWPGCSCVNYT